MQRDRNQEGTLDMDPDFEGLPALGDSPSESVSQGRAACRVARTGLEGDAGNWLGVDGGSTSLVAPDCGGLRTC